MSNQSKSNPSQPRRRDGKAHAPLAGLDAPADVVELLGELWAPMAGERPDARADVAARALRLRLGDQHRGWEAPRVRRAREALDRYLQTISTDAPAAPPALEAEPLPMPAVLAAAASGERPLGFTFGGQSVTGYWDELTTLYRHSTEARALVTAMARRLRDEVDAMTPADRAYLPDGLDLVRWLDEPASRPSDDYVNGTIVSQPLIFVTQAAQYARLLASGYGREELWRSVRASAGHSQGLMPALLVSETFGSTAIVERACDYAAYLLFQGLRMRQAYSAPAVPPAMRAEAEEAGAGTPSPMASVTGLTRDELVAGIERLGLDLHVSLDNARLRKVVSGDPADIEALRRVLADDFAARKKAKSQGRHGGALVERELQYLPFGGAYHSPHMAAGVEPMLADCERMGFRLERASLAIPVIDTATGEDVREAEDVLRRVVELQFVRSVDWVSCARAVYDHGARTVLDFGPGEGVYRMTAAALRGSGAVVLGLATDPGRAAALRLDRAPEAPTPYASYAPGLVEGPDGVKRLDNRYTRATGRSAVILPGMTPTTVEADIVVAAANAGHTSELAGGGQVTAPMLRRRMAEIAAKLAPGAGVVLNALYLDPYLWKLQFGEDELVLRLRDEGYPLVGVTVSAGIPPVEESAALLRALVARGVWLNSFKPGTDEQVKTVLAIADAVPEVTFTIQIEGGKAGGHHSWEDLHDVVARHYDAIRQRGNLLLAVGGGIATGEDATGYLCGAWSVPYGLPPMPVDAVFVGTIAMAAREARTAPSVKAELAAATGTRRWVLDGKAEGGVTSGRSQLDASIYYLDNAAARAGRLLDELAKDPDSIPAHEAEIVAALARTAKPYFGRVEDMTYAAFLARAVELMAIGQGGTYEDGRWLDRSHRRRFLDLVRLGEARLHGGDAPFASIVAGEADLDDPEAVLAAFCRAYPAAESTRVHPQDARAFVDVCRGPGKPVNFVPVIDRDVRRWYKSDSLWQSHHPHFGPGTTHVVPGPEAIAGIQAVDEPVAEILGRLEAHTVETLIRGEAPVRKARWASEWTRVPGEPVGAEGSWTCGEEEERWLERVSRLGTGPLAAALTPAEAVVESATLEGELRVVRNPLARLFAPAPRHVLSWKAEADGTLRELELRDPDGHACARAKLGRDRDGRFSLRARLVALCEPAAGEVELDLGLEWVEDATLGHLAWRFDEYLEAQREFYDRAIFGEPVPPVKPFETATDRVTVGSDAVSAFVLATGDDSRGLAAKGRIETPLNMAFALAWRSIYRAFAGARADVVSLLHEDNAVEAGPAWPAVAGDALTTRARMTSEEALPGGRRIVVHAELLRGDDLVARVASTFFVRAPFAAGAAALTRRAPFAALVHVADRAAREVLLEQPWLTVLDPAAVEPGAWLRVECPVYAEERDGEGWRFAAEGTLYAGGTAVGAIALAPEHVPAGCRRHPVAELCSLLGEPRADVALTAPRALGTKRLGAPADMAPYARASGDHNPLHLRAQVARFAGLPAPIVHGMWTASAAVHRAVRLGGEGDARRLRQLETRFLAPVERGEPLAVRVRQIAMRRGSRVVELDAVVSDARGERPVLSGKVVLAPPKQAYVFPGQGLQRVGMGMQGYARSAAARAVWDEAEATCRERLGFSLLHVVRDNPKELTVRGATLRHPSGVLFLTQFTQVAMAVMAIAQVRELEERGAFDAGAMFCGHSVGEYSAIAAIARVLPVDGTVEIVYQRGTTMDVLVERDAHGRSPYGMGVIRPHQAGLDETGAQALVREVAAATGRPLEIVNYNIRGKQYSVTGHVEALAELADRLAARQGRRTGKDVRPAYLTVEGIDVPFHSTLLRDGVPLFRETLSRIVSPRFDPQPLVGRYVPNLVARPFALTREFAESIVEASGSPVVVELLARWDEAVRDEATVARKLFLELLAYQFASPVRWIETQELLFAPETGLEQLVEVGLGEQPILGNMAKATLAGMPDRAQRVRVMHVEQHADELLGPSGIVEDDPAPVVASEPVAATARQAVPAASPSAAPAAGSAATPSATAAPAAPVPTSAAPVTAAPAASSVDDAAPSVAEALKLVLALQTRTRPEQLTDTETLDELLGGNSAKRNQVLADVGGELGVGAVDGAHELPLGELARQLAARAPRYQAPGKYLGAALEQALARALGAARLGREEVVQYLGRAWGLGPGRALGVALRIPIAARDGVSPRGGALSPAPVGSIADRAAAEAWLDTLVAAYGREQGLTLARPAAAHASAGAAVDPAALLALEDRLLGPDGALTRAARALDGRELGRALASDSRAEADRARLARYDSEHGEAYEAAIAPMFDADKHLALTSSWAWSRRDVLALASALARGEAPSEETLRRLGRRLDAAAVRSARALATIARREHRDGDAAVLEALATAAVAEPRFVSTLVPSAPTLEVDEQGEWRSAASPRPGEASAAAFVEAQLESFLHPVRVVGHESTLPVQAYPGALRASAAAGLSFTDRTALVTGAGPGSIALELVKNLLEGGARVVLTTTTYTPARLAFYKRLYQEHAAPGAELHVVPANQGSLGDVDALVRWMTTAQPDAIVHKEAWLPDLLVPFGALGENGYLGGGERAQAVLRVLLLGVERLVAGLAAALRADGTGERRCHVLLPLSPNHGAFGGDGLYAESKAALEAVLAKWRSEQSAWGRHTTVVGARIGWVRSTGLMSGNDLLAAPLEADTGVRTYAPEEMGLLLTALCADEVREAARREPLVADLTGGFATIGDLSERVGGLREGLATQAADRKRARELRRLLRERLVGAEATTAAEVKPRPRHDVEAPRPTDAELEALPALDHLDPTRVVVVVGYGETSPYGSSRTRWAVERDGVLSLEAVTELAWMMGLVRPRKDGAGFEDAKSGEAVADLDIKARYEQEVLAHTGIRVTDPELAHFDPRGAVAWTDVRLEQDFRFGVRSRAEAELLAGSDPEHSSVLVEPDGTYTLLRKKGALVRVPRAFRIDRNVAGQVPSGWDAQRYGINKELCEQVDRVTLFNLVATAEAFAQAGMDPEEIYAYLHPSRVSTTQSSGIGGMHKLARLYRDYVEGKERQTDVLQETLINVVAAYVVQTYLGCYGPMSFPVGACATAAVSVQNAVEQILANETDLVVAGGVDDYGPEGAVGFSDMNATASTESLARLGVEPRALSRPNDRRRKGFVESQGAGALILCRASIAIELGLPVYGVVAYAASFADGIHRSVPAPGIGTLAAAAEAPVEGRDPAAACDLEGRRARVAEIEARASALAEVLGAETAERMVREARRFYGHEFYREDPTVSPLRGALAVLGLGPDDVAVVSKHDTSTQANDLNENRLHAGLARKLGRTADLPLAVISQKSLTGHPKGAAAAWQMIGLLQAMADGVIPANRSLEDVDPAMAEFAPLTFTDRPIAVGRGRLRAGLVTSLGFGHVGAIVALAHPYLFWRLLKAEARARYVERLSARTERATRKLRRVLAGHEPLLTPRTRRPFQAKDGTAEQAAEEAAMLLDSRSRLAPGATTYRTAQD